MDTQTTQDKVTELEAKLEAAVLAWSKELCRADNLEAEIAAKINNINLPEEK